jgi:16S rRNA (adenine1518-N6/adenine1519-N6)-dimethyltransferase
MQTKQQILELLSSAGVRPNKRLGQHFLIDLNLMRLLVELAQITGDDIVLEVGCGTGSLTQALAERAGYVIAVELDEAVAKIAERELSEAKNVEIIIADILAKKSIISGAVADALKHSREKYTGRVLLVANLPYSVASVVILNLVMGDIPADGMYVTVQKEVAERMTAAAGSKDYGTLSIFLGAAGEVKIERILKPSVFWPQPRVDSAMVSFVRKAEKVGRIKNMEVLREVVNLFMGHRRKMLKGCTRFSTGRLAEIDNWDEIFERCAIDHHKRPEQVLPEGYIAIANLCSEYLKFEAE